MPVQVISGSFDGIWRNIASAVSVRTLEEQLLFEKLLPTNRCLASHELISMARTIRQHASDVLPHRLQGRT